MEVNVALVTSNHLYLYINPYACITELSNMGSCYVFLYLVVLTFRHLGIKLDIGQFQLQTTILLKHTGRQEYLVVSVIYKNLTKVIINFEFN